MLRVQHFMISIYSKLKYKSIMQYYLLRAPLAVLKCLFRERSNNALYKVSGHVPHAESMTNEQAAQ
jgi:hypothetical protein